MNVSRPTAIPVFGGGDAADAPKPAATPAPSGNAAFDAYKREALDKLEAERRKLDEEQKAFHAFVDKLRRAKDQDKFDRFMAEHRNPGEAPAA